MTTITPSLPSPPTPTPTPRQPGPRPSRPRPLTTARALDPFRVLRRHMLAIMAAGIVGIVLGIGTHVLCSVFFPRYSGEVLFEIQTGLDDASEVGTAEQINQDDLVLRLASTERMLLVSREVLTTAAKSRDVQSTAWFRDNYVRDGTALVDEAVDELLEDATGKLLPGTNLFALNWSSSKDADVPVVLNTISRAYIERREGLDNERSRQSVDVFTRELTDTNRKIDDLRMEIEKFIREKNIENLIDTRASTVAEFLKTLSDSMNQEKSSLSMAQSVYMQTAAKLEGTIQPSDQDRSEAEMDPTVRQSEMAILQIKTDLRHLREIYRNQNHFSINLAEGRLRALELEYQDKVREIMVKHLHARLKAAADQIESLRSLLEEQEKEFEDKSILLKALAADMATMLSMQSANEALETTRDDLQKTIQEARLIQLRRESQRVRIAQPALTPREKSFPRVEIVVPLVTILVVGLVTGLIFLREMTDQRVKSVSDLDLLAGTRVLGMVPELDEDPCRSDSAELVVRRCPRSVLAESFRQTWTNIDKGLARAGHQTLLVLGGLPETGSTTVITNLAAAAVATGRRVVVLDGNFRRPRLARALGVLADAAGLGDVLMGKAELDSVIRHSEWGIDVVGPGLPESRTFERLANGAIDSVLAVLRTRYDLVLLDAPPAVVAGDAMALASKVDAAVLVVRANREQRGLVARLAGQLSDSRCELLGIVLNRPRGTAGGYFKKNFATMAKYAQEKATES